MQGSINFSGGLNGSIASSGSLSGSIDTSESGSDVTIQPTLFEGQKIAEYTIDGVGGELYAPTGSGGSSVDIDPVLAAGVKIADYTIDGVDGELYAPAATDVDITPTYNSGVKVADYSIGSENGSIYVPGSTPPGFDSWVISEETVIDTTISSNDRYIQHDFDYDKPSRIQGKRTFIRGVELRINNQIRMIQYNVIWEDSDTLTIRFIIDNPSQALVSEINFKLYLISI